MTNQNLTFIQTEQLIADSQSDKYLHESTIANKSNDPLQKSLLTKLMSGQKGPLLQMVSVAIEVATLENMSG
jgi:hypothetical protein